MAWNSSKEDKSKQNGNGRATVSGGGGVNTIDAKTRINGDITAGGNIRIDGTLVGNLNCEALLVIGPQGKIEGDVVCQKAIIEGTFTGNIVVKEELTLEATSNVSGDVKAGKMAVLGGSKVNGTCTVPYTGGPTAGRPKSDNKSNPLKKAAGVES